MYEGRVAMNDKNKELRLISIEEESHASETSKRATTRELLTTLAYLYEKELEELHLDLPEMERKFDILYNQ